MFRRRLPTVKPTAIDRLISFIDPVRGARRMRSRWAIGALTGSFRGASTSRRPTQEWKPRTQSADSALVPDLPTLRERARDLTRNNPLAAGAIHTKVTSVVGPGLSCHPRVDAEALGLTEAEAEAWERQAERAWRLWAESRECDITRGQTFGEMQSLVFRSVLESGDVFVIKRFRERAGSPYLIKLQVVEGDRVSNPGNKQDKMTLTGGVEMDADGSPTAYHIMKFHPGDRVRSSKPEEWARVPAYSGGTGRRLVLHLYRRLRPDQTRGMPDLAPVVEAFKQLGDYTDGELQAAVISSFFSVFVKTPTGDGLAPMEPTDETGASSADTDLKMAPGAILDLAAGEEIEVANPGRPNDSFDMFVQSVLRQIGVALELPFEILIKHFTASYSAARAALLEAWKYYRGRRQWLAAEFCQPVYEEVLAEEIARGNLAAPGFFNSAAIRKAYLGADWVGPGMAQIDPNKENQADALAEDRGWKTAREITAEKTGGDWARNNTQRAKEERARRDGGLAPATSSGTDAPAPDGGADEKPEDETEDVA